MAPTSALPIGAARVVSEMQPLLVDPSLSGSGLYNAVLAVLATPNADETERYDEEILDLPVLGFIVMCVSRCLSTSLSLSRTLTDRHVWHAAPRWTSRTSA